MLTRVSCQGSKTSYMAVKCDKASGSTFNEHDGGKNVFLGCLYRLYFVLPLRNEIKSEQPFLVSRLLSRTGRGTRGAQRPSVCLRHWGDAG